MIQAITQITNRVSKQTVSKHDVSFFNSASSLKGVASTLDLSQNEVCAVTDTSAARPSLELFGAEYYRWSVGRTSRDSRFVELWAPA
jgi:hypothetical protein